MTRMRPDWQSEVFWRWACDTCDARPAILARWFPNVARSTWETRKRVRRGLYGHLPWPDLRLPRELRADLHPGQAHLQDVRPQGTGALQGHAGDAGYLEAPVLWVRAPGVVHRRAGHDEGVREL